MRMNWFLDRWVWRCDQRPLIPRPGFCRKVQARQRVEEIRVRTLVGVVLRKSLAVVWLLPRTEPGPVRSPYYSEVWMPRTRSLDSVQHRPRPNGQFEIHRGRLFPIVFCGFSGLLNASRSWLSAICKLLLNAFGVWMRLHSQRIGMLLNTKVRSVAWPRSTAKPQLLRSAATSNSNRMLRGSVRRPSKLVNGVPRTTIRNFSASSEDYSFLNCFLSTYLPKV